VRRWWVSSQCLHWIHQFRNFWETRFWGTRSGFRVSRGGIVLACGLAEIIRTLVDDVHMSRGREMPAGGRRGIGELRQIGRDDTLNPEHLGRVWKYNNELDHGPNCSIFDFPGFIVAI
jgi:hypothetical protein